MTTEAQKRAVRRYDAKNTKQYHLKLNLKSDAAIIAHLDSIDNVQGYIKGLILSHMYMEPLSGKKSDNYSDNQTMTENDSK